VSKLAKGPIGSEVDNLEQDERPISGPGAALQAYLVEEDQERADRLLVELVCDVAQPVAKKIIASKLGADRNWAATSRELQDAEDVCNEVLVQLLKRLRRMKASPQPEILADFAGYVAVTAFNACHHYLRKKYPERYRLKNRLRYALTRDERVAMWEGSGRWVCGLAEWRSEKRPVADLERVRSLLEGSDLVPWAGIIFDGTPREIASLMHGLFVRLENPVEFDELVGGMVDIAQATESRDAGQLESEIGDGAYASGAISRDADRVEQQLYLRRLWSEILELPPRQRAALLLSLRDEDGWEVITLLVYERVASLDAVAEALQLPLGELVELWKRLPIDDATIAEELGLSRQQVINLRVSARRRLARKMGGPPARLWDY
jgi:RNA polymerase sigma factor (sigma-70 family)